MGVDLLVIDGHDDVANLKPGGFGHPAILEAEQHDSYPERGGKRKDVSRGGAEVGVGGECSAV